MEENEKVLSFANIDEDIYKQLLKSQKAIPVNLYLSEKTKIKFLSSYAKDIFELDFNVQEEFDIQEIEKNIFNEDVPELKNRIKNSISNNVPFQVEFRYQTKSSEVKYFLGVGYLKSLDERIIEGFLFEFSDIVGVMSELEVSREQYRLIIDNMQEAIIQVDNDDVILFCNEQLCKLTQYSMDELIGKIGYEIYFDREEQNIIKQKNTERLVHKKDKYDVQIKRKDGKKIWVNISASQLIDKNGIVYGSIGILTDIHERKEAEELLKLSEEKYSNLIEAMPEGFYMSSPDGKFIDINPAMVKMCGYDSKEEIMKISIPNDLYFSEEERSSGGAVNEEFIDKPEIIRLKKKDGSELWIEDYCRYIRDEKNKIIIHEGLCRDITEKIINERNIRKINLRLDLISRVTSTINCRASIDEQINLYIDLLKAVFQIDYCILRFLEQNNLKLVACSGVEKDSLDENVDAGDGIGKEIIEKKHAISISDVQNNEITREVKQSKYPLRWKSYCGAPLMIENEVIGILAIYTLDEVREFSEIDREHLQIIANHLALVIENKRLNEDLEAKNKSLQNELEEKEKIEKELLKAKIRAEEADSLKSIFLANMSHEIRTPMNGLIGFADLLDNESMTEEKRKQYLKIIKESSHQLLSIVNDVLDISKLQTNQFKVNNTNFNLNQLLSNLFLFYKPKADELNISLKMKSLLKDDESNIIGDNVKLKQILMNFLNNSFKFTLSGGIEYGYTLKSGILEFYVSDTGIGIPEEYQQKIFDRFQQVGDVTSSAVKGTGLGLAICKGMVELMGGKIWIESKLNQGSVFYFTLPYAKSYREISSDKVLEKEEIYEINGQKIILVADDSDVNYIYLEELLTSNGFICLRAKDGEDAVEKIKKYNNIDLILMDLKMPKMDGYEASRIIHSINTEVPIIAQTAYSLTEEIEKLKEYKFADVINKPVDRQTILSIVKKNLRNG